MEGWRTGGLEFSNLQTTTALPAQVPQSSHPPVLEPSIPPVSKPLSNLSPPTSFLQLSNPLIPQFSSLPFLQFSNLQTTTALPAQVPQSSHPPVLEPSIPPVSKPLSNLSPPTSFLQLSNPLIPQSSLPFLQFSNLQTTTVLPAQVPQSSHPPVLEPSIPPVSKPLSNLSPPTSFLQLSNPLIPQFSSLPFLQFSNLQTTTALPAQVPQSSHPPVLEPSIPPVSKPLSNLSPPTSFLQLSNPLIPQFSSLPFLQFSNLQTTTALPAQVPQSSHPPVLEPSIPPVSKPLSNLSPPTSFLQLSNPLIPQFSSLPFLQFSNLQTTTALPAQVPQSSHPPVLEPSIPPVSKPLSNLSPPTSFLQLSNPLIPQFSSLPFLQFSNLQTTTALPAQVPQSSHPPVLEPSIPPVSKPLSNLSPPTSFLQLSNPLIPQFSSLPFLQFSNLQTTTALPAQVPQSSHPPVLEPSIPPVSKPLSNLSPPTSFLQLSNPLIPQFSSLPFLQFSNLQTTTALPAQVPQSSHPPVLEPSIPPVSKPLSNLSPPTSFLQLSNPLIPQFSSLPFLQFSNLQTTTALPAQVPQSSHPPVLEPSIPPVSKPLSNLSPPTSFLQLSNPLIPQFSSLPFLQFSNLQTTTALPAQVPQSSHPPVLEPSIPPVSKPLSNLSPPTSFLQLSNPLIPQFSSLPFLQFSNLQTTTALPAQVPQSSHPPVLEPSIPPVSKPLSNLSPPTSFLQLSNPLIPQFSSLPFLQFSNLQTTTALPAQVPQSSHPPVLEPSIPPVSKPLSNLSPPTSFLQLSNPLIPQFSSLPFLQFSNLQTTTALPAQVPQSSHPPVLEPSIPPVSKPLSNLSPPTSFLQLSNPLIPQFSSLPFLQFSNLQTTTALPAQVPQSSHPPVLEPSIPPVSKPLSNLSPPTSFLQLSNPLIPQFSSLPFLQFSNLQTTTALPAQVPQSSHPPVLEPSIPPVSKPLSNLSPPTSFLQLSNPLIPQFSSLPFLQFSNLQTTTALPAQVPQSSHPPVLEPSIPPVSKPLSNLSPPTSFLQLSNPLIPQFSSLPFLQFSNLQTTTALPAQVPQSSHPPVLEPSIPPVSKPLSNLSPPTSFLQLSNPLIPQFSSLPFLQFSNLQTTTALPAQVPQSSHPPVLEPSIPPVSKPLSNLSPPTSFLQLSNPLIPQFSSLPFLQFSNLQTTTALPAQVPQSSHPPVLEPSIPPVSKPLSNLSPPTSFLQLSNPLIPQFSSLPFLQFSNLQTTTALPAQVPQSSHPPVLEPSIPPVSKPLSNLSPPTSFLQLSNPLIPQFSSLPFLQFSNLQTTTALPAQVPQSSHPPVLEPSIPPVSKPLSNLSPPTSFLQLSNPLIPQFSSLPFLQFSNLQTTTALPAQVPQSSHPPVLEPSIPPVSKPLSNLSPPTSFLQLSNPLIPQFSSLPFLQFSNLQTTTALPAQVPQSSHPPVLEPSIPPVSKPLSNLSPPTSFLQLSNPLIPQFSSLPFLQFSNLQTTTALPAQVPQSSHPPVLEPSIPPVSKPLSNLSPPTSFLQLSNPLIPQFSSLPFLQFSNLQTTTALPAQVPQSSHPPVLEPSIPPVSKPLSNLSPPTSFLQLSNPLIPQFSSLPFLQFSNLQTTTALPAQVPQSSHPPVLEPSIPPVSKPLSNLSPPTSFLQLSNPLIPQLNQILINESFFIIKINLNY